MLIIYVITPSWDIPLSTLFIGLSLYLLSGSVDLLVPTLLIYDVYITGDNFFPNFVNNYEKKKKMV